MNAASRVFIRDFKPMNTKSEFKTGTKPFGGSDDTGVAISGPLSLAGGGIGVLIRKTYLWFLRLLLRSCLPRFSPAISR